MNKTCIMNHSNDDVFITCNVEAASALEQDINYLSFDSLNIIKKSGNFTEDQHHLSDQQFLSTTIGSSEY